MFAQNSQGAMHVYKPIRALIRSTTRTLTVKTHARQTSDNAYCTKHYTDIDLRICAYLLLLMIFLLARNFIDFFQPVGCSVSSAKLLKRYMDYYHCSNEALRQEGQRRALASYGGHDELSEILREDDDTRGSEATTVVTEPFEADGENEANLFRTRAFGRTIPVDKLVDESAYSSLLGS